MFEHRGSTGGSTLAESAGMKLMQQNEGSFMQRVTIDKRFGVNCLRLTLWEYMLLIEQMSKEQDK